jgi:hypothetical protein
MTHPIIAWIRQRRWARRCVWVLLTRICFVVEPIEHAIYGFRDGWYEAKARSARWYRMLDL